MSHTPRYELKFVVRDADKHAVLDALRAGLRPDPHGEQACYRVTSQYFDSPSFTCFWEKLDGVSVRSKLRLRMYGDVDNPQALDRHATFLEIKHRLGEGLYKERIRMDAAGAGAILADAHALTHLGDVVASKDPEAQRTIARIERMAGESQLGATATVTYRREAWIGQDDARLRVTWDSWCQVLPADRLFFAPRNEGVPLLRQDCVILELKFDHAIPCWVKDVVTAAGLQVGRFSKYATGIDRLHDMHRRRRHVLLAAAHPRERVGGAP